MSRSAGSRLPGISGSLLLIVIALFLVIAFAWASLTEIDEVTRATGKIVPSRSLQVIESLEGGVVERIAVTKGQQVSRGDILMVLNPGMLGGAFQESQQRYYGLLARSIRLQAETRGDEAPGVLEFPDEIASKAPDVMDAQVELYRANLLRLTSEIRVLQRQKQQKQIELQALEGELESLDRSSALSEEELALIQPLVAQSLEPRTELLRLQRQLEDLRGEAQSKRHSLRRLAVAIEEIDLEIDATRNRFAAEARSELGEVAGEIAELRETLPVRADQVARARLRSPVDGVVNRLHVSTIGSVADPGEALVEIVPGDDRLVVEAYVKPADIGFLYPDQPVKIKITAYDFARYGGLEGRLATIGADVVEVPDLEEKMYPVEVSTTGVLRDAGGQPLDIIPGMVVEVDILSGKRTVLDYLIEPVVKVKQNAFRD